MAASLTYSRMQAITTEGERAFAQLYVRLARWCGELLDLCRAQELQRYDALIERSIYVIGIMDGLIDVSRHYQLACRILSLHRFAVRSLVKAKLNPGDGELADLAKVFATLGETFELMARRGAGREDAAG